jgi:hypothetical protein
VVEVEIPGAARDVDRPTDLTQFAGLRMLS